MSILENNKKIKWKTIGFMVKEAEIPLFNQRLKMFGYDTAGQLIKDFINGTFPAISEDKQINALSNNEDKSGLNSVLEGGYNTDFYERADTKDMYDYYYTVRKYHKNTCRDLVNYFKRHREQFFGNRVDELRSLTPRVRSRIMDSMRKFGQYYVYKYNNEQCIDLVEKIIRRHNLNAGMTEHGKLYIVDDSYLQKMVQALLSVGEGDIGTIIRFGLYSGLREDEMIYVHQKSICSDKSGCACNKLHVIDKPNGMTVVLIQWHRGNKKCYFTIVPTQVFKDFKALDEFRYRPHITSSHEYMKVRTKDDKITFMWLRKAHYNVMCRVMKPFEANILAGRAKSVDAKHYAMYELNEMSEKYAEAWNKVAQA
jgi:intergrase/recombinase